jgi:hypothetical protein
VTALELSVERKLATVWPLVADQVAARLLLLTYGSANGEQEVERVRMAVIKLSGGALDELTTMTTAAKSDYRDVLMWAEYPEESRATWASRSDLTNSERQELAGIHARDRKQYEDWRNR